MLKILMDEMVCIRNELKEEMAEMRKELKADIDRVDGKLTTAVKELKSDIRNLSYRVDQNHVSFMKNFDDVDQKVGNHEKRITRLEKVAA